MILSLAFFMHESYENNLSGNIVMKEENSLRAFYEFDSSQNFIDSSENGNNLVNYGTGFSAAGYQGSRRFNGFAYLTAKDSDSLDIEKELTIYVMIYPEESLSKEWILYKGNKENANYYFGQDGRDLVFGVIDEGVEYEINNPDKEYLSLNSWQQVAVTYSESEKIVKIYKDGKEVYSENFEVEMKENEGELNVGRRGGFRDYYFNGGIDELRIYEKALTPDEILSLYNDRNSEVGLVQREICLEDWRCNDWGECVEGKQIRTCDDENLCETENNKPSESRECSEEKILKRKEFSMPVILGLALLLLTLVIILKKRK